MGNCLQCFQSSDYSGSASRPSASAAQTNLTYIDCRIVTNAIDRTVQRERPGGLIKLVIWFRNTNNSRI